MNISRNLLIVALGIIIMSIIGYAFYVTYFVAAPIPQTQEDVTEQPGTIPPLVREDEIFHYTNASADHIIVDLPTPGAVTGKSFSVLGRARGNWFFEASFPVELKDEQGNILGQGIAQAQSDWMTTEFVSFKADISAPESFIGKAVLILKRDNPSGLPEYDGSVSFPITVEY
jgi:hypothetical protein